MAVSGMDAAKIRKKMGTRTRSSAFFFQKITKNFHLLSIY